MSFKTLGLSQVLLSTLEANNYKQPYPIQKEAIPTILNNSDILAIAPTGSGKTAAYVLPIIDIIQKIDLKKNRNINVLILVPTRELAVQVNEVFRMFNVGFDKQIKSLAVFGGVSINPQMKALLGVNILVATPGRLLELVEKNAVQLSNISTLVLDEADKMLNLGFKDELNQIIRLLPEKRQNILLSATLNNDVKSINKSLLHNPKIINVEAKVESTELINQIAYFVSEDRKGPLLRYLIKTQELKQVLVFVSSIKRADNVANKLRNNGIQAWPIHSKKTQGARTDLLTKFKHGKLQVLVATDLISRGIDIELLPCVINYELPRSPKDYIHRIGRTGRAESAGTAISLITPDEEHHFKIIQKKVGKVVNFKSTDDFELKGY